MSVNKNALIRYKTIDKCLQNRHRKWTLDDLINACSEVLYEYEGKDTSVSKRTVQADIQIMRSDKLGYFAPIMVVDKKYYTYEDADYTITNIPLTEQDLNKLSEAVEFMKQFQGFSHFKELDGMVQKLEDHIYSHKTATKPVIDFEKNDSLKGLAYLDELYNAIIKKQTINLTYRSFKARSSASFNFYPYLLKEFRNRWILLGKKAKSPVIMNLALDRILAIDKGTIPFKEDEMFDASSHFKNAIGVSVSPESKLLDIELLVNHQHAPYVLTKPIHPSQKVLGKNGQGVIIGLTLQHNFELEKEILSFGESIKVLEPPMLRKRIAERLENNLENYLTELSKKGLQNAVNKLNHKGFSVLNNIYTSREIRKIKRMLDTSLRLEAGEFSVRDLFNTNTDLPKLLFNTNIKQILAAISPKAFVCKAIYFDKSEQGNWFVTWHQDLTINVSKKIETEGFFGWTKKEDVISVCPPPELSHSLFTIRIHLDETTGKNGALLVIPGSHKKVHTDTEKQLITENTNATVVDVAAGGIMLMKPLLLHKSGKNASQKRRRVVHLEFSESNLPNDLAFSERYEIEP
jgi:predicted DNA-binding transcriptional regulator YafY